MTNQTFNVIPLTRFFVDMEKQDEPLVTFSKAFSVIGLITQRKLDQAEKVLWEMDTSPREHLLDALEESGLL